MPLVLRILKNLLFWHYGRTTWQYDVLSVLILAFIFLTPQRWFDNGELRSSRTHRRDVAAQQVILSAETLPPNPSSVEIEQRLQVLTNRPHVQAKDVRPVRDAAGKTVAYEVDIR